MAVGLLGACALIASGIAMAQSVGPAAAQQRYERQIAQCNSGQRPAPEREACVRNAGRLLDRANGGTPPQPVPQESADGRAIVMTPPGAPPPRSASDYVTSPDGRAVIAVPPTGDRIVRP
ncbi:MAG: hypothetical protein JSR41_23665 [Proteobacteria bacterium]|nr:hypothetical protein [Pseudomonadota bacterium]